MAYTRGIALAAAGVITVTAFVSYNTYITGGINYLKDVAKYYKLEHRYDQRDLAALRSQVQTLQNQITSLTEKEEILNNIINAYGIEVEENDTAESIIQKINDKIAESSLKPMEDINIIAGYLDIDTNSLFSSYYNEHQAELEGKSPLEATNIFYNNVLSGLVKSKVQDIVNERNLFDTEVKAIGTSLGLDFSTYENDSSLETYSDKMTAYLADIEEAIAELKDFAQTSNSNMMNINVEERNQATSIRDAINEVKAIDNLELEDERPTQTLPEAPATPEELVPTQGE